MSQMVGGEGGRMSQMVGGEGGKNESLTNVSL